MKQALDVPALRRLTQQIALLLLFEDRFMLASVGMNVDPSLGAELDRWLATVYGAVYYRISLEREDERAALLGALSRKVVRGRRVRIPPRTGSQEWIVDAASSAGPSLILNESLRRIAVAEFSPLPIASRIPYASVPAHAVLVLDEATAEAMGLQEARDRLAAV